MSLWNNTDANTGAPKFQVGVDIGAGVKANGLVAYQNVTTGVFVSGQKVGVFGVDSSEKSNTASEGPKVTHAGWVKRTVGTGFIQSIAVSNGGANYNANGFILFTGGGGSGANASFTINTVSNTINSVTVVNRGSNYNAAPTVAAGVANTTPATFTVTMGGRTGRITYETLVAMGSMTPGANTDNGYFLP